MDVKPRLLFSLGRLCWLLGGTAIGYGGQFDQPLQASCGLVFPSFDCTDRQLHPLDLAALTLPSSSPSCPLPLRRTSSRFIHAQIV